MFQLHWAIIDPKTERSRGTFSDCALYGIPYSLQFQLYYKSYVNLLADVLKIEENIKYKCINACGCQYCEILRTDI